MEQTGEKVAILRSLIDLMPADDASLPGHINALEDAEFELRQMQANDPEEERFDEDFDENNVKHNIFNDLYIMFYHYFY